MNKKETRKQQKVIHCAASQIVMHCKRCGTCCQKGGPALHKEDRKILLAGLIQREQLVTIRKGELAFSPLSGRIEPLQHEIVKIAGKGKQWACAFHNRKESSCAIYTHRPLECRLLKCWDTAKLLSVIGKDTLTRADIIDRDDPIFPFIETHDKECSLQIAADLISVLSEKKDDPISLAKLTALVHHDLALRSKAISEFGLSLEAELFIFGRPLFKIMRGKGLQNFMSMAD